jgi:hypothetical protein
MPPRWVRFAECSRTSVRLVGFAPSIRLVGFVSRNALHPASASLGSFRRTVSVPPQHYLVDSFGLIALPSPVLGASSKSVHVVKCPIVGIPQSNLNPQKVLYISGHLAALGSFAHFSYPAHDSTSMAIARSALWLAPPRWLRSRAVIARRILGSFRKALPSSVARLAVFVSVDPSSAFHPPPAEVRPTPSIQYDLQIPKKSCISALGFFVMTATMLLGLSPVSPVARLFDRLAQGQVKAAAVNSQTIDPNNIRPLDPVCRRAAKARPIQSFGLRIWPRPRNPRTPIRPLSALHAPLPATHHPANGLCDAIIEGLIRKRSSIERSPGLQPGG